MCVFPFPVLFHLTQHASSMCHPSSAKTLRSGQWPALDKVNWRLNAFICVLSTTRNHPLDSCTNLRTEEKNPMMCEVECPAFNSPNQAGWRLSQNYDGIRKNFNVTFILQSNLWGKVHASYLLFIIKSKQSINSAI